MNSSLLHQLYPVCLDTLTWIVCEMGMGVGVQLHFCGVLLLDFVHDSKKHSCVVLIYLLHIFVVMYPYSSARIFYQRDRFRSLSLAIHCFAMRVLASLLVDVILLSTYVNCFIDFKSLLFNVEMALSCLKYMKCILFAFTWRFHLLNLCHAPMIRLRLVYWREGLYHRCSLRLS